MPLNFDEHSEQDNLSSIRRPSHFGTLLAPVDNLVHEAKVKMWSAKMDVELAEKLAIEIEDLGFHLGEQSDIISAKQRAINAKQSFQEMKQIVDSLPALHEAQQSKLLAENELGLHDSALHAIDLSKHISEICMRLAEIKRSVSRTRQKRVGVLHKRTLIGAANTVAVLIAGLSGPVIYNVGDCVAFITCLVVLGVNLASSLKMNEKDMDSTDL